MAVTVLHVLEALEGGTARHLVDLVTHANGVRHEVAMPRRRSVGITDESALAALTAAGVTVHVVDMRRAPPSPRNAVALAGLRRLVQRRRPEVVHGHSAVGGALARLAVWAVPTARVYTPNGLRTDAASVAMERGLGRLTDRLVAVSPSEGELVLRLGLVPPERLAVVPNGIAPEAPPAAGVGLRERLGLAPATPLVGTVARLVPQKSPLVFVRAADLLARSQPDVHAVLVGSGRLRSQVEREVAAAPALAGRFHHLDVLPGVSGMLGDLDVFVLISAFEGGPYTPLEAMRAGAAVVLSDVVGNRDVVEPGVSGLLVPAGSPAVAATAVAGLLADPARRRALVEAGRARVALKFTAKAMGAAMSQLYQEAGRQPGAYKAR